MQEAKLTDAPMIPPIGQLAVYDSYVRSMKLYVACGVLFGWIQVI